MLRWRDNILVMAARLNVLSVAQVAAELGASDTYVRRLLTRQLLYGVKVGPVWAIARDDLESFKRMRRRPGRPRKEPLQARDEIEMQRRITRERASAGTHEMLRGPRRGA